MKLTNTGYSTKPTIKNDYLILAELLIQQPGKSLRLLFCQKKTGTRRKRTFARTFLLAQYLTALRFALAKCHATRKHPLKYSRTGGVTRYRYSGVTSFADLNKHTNSSVILERAK